MTSLVDLGLPVTLEDVDLALRQTFEPIFGETRLSREDIESGNAAKALV